MKTALLLAGSGPLVIATSHSSLTDPELLDQLHAKGIDKFIGYELPLRLVTERYGGHFVAETHDLHQSKDLQVIDFNGERAFNLFRFSELGRRVVYEKEDGSGAVNIDLPEEVCDALAFEPSVQSDNIGVMVENGIVTLTGSVGSYSEKLKAEEVVRHVKGVRAVFQKLEVRSPSEDEISDEEITKRALSILAWQTQIPKDMIQVGVSDGWVTLSGQVEWHYQKAAAETSLHRVQGVKGIRNDVVVLPPDEITDIKARIERALRRVAEVEAERIDVSVIGQTVVLDGEVGSWVERDAVNDAARATPGVSIVDDRLRVSDLR